MIQKLPIVTVVTLNCIKKLKLDLSSLSTEQKSTMATLRMNISVGALKICSVNLSNP